MTILRLILVCDQDSLFEFPLVTSSVECVLNSQALDTVAGRREEDGPSAGRTGSVEFCAVFVRKMNLEKTLE